MSPPLPPSLLFAALLAAYAAPVSATPIITEFLASNQTGLADEDGARPDWIEIFNPDATAVDLGGYHLSDDRTQPERWTFPAGVTIQAGGYLIVFASGKDRAVAGSPLHTDFNLSAAGEDLLLTAPGGTPVLSQFLAFPNQTADVSYGPISTTPGAENAFFNTPTPGAANNPTTAPAEAVQFSLSSRTFSSTTPLSISLSVSSPTATIRYTTNRSVPTASSTLYDGTPIPVSVNTRIRARAFEPGRPDGPLRSEMYFALDAAAMAFTSNLPIVITETWSVVPASDVVVPAYIMIFEPKTTDNNLARMTNLPDIATPCSVERRGSSTAGDPKYSLTVELWDESNNDRNFKVLGMPSDSDWIMHAPYSFDRPMMHNDLIYRLSNDAGRYAVRTKFVEHFHNTNIAPTMIGGALTGAVDYFGVYSFMEKITREEDRVDVEPLTTLDNTAPIVQGGYMFKADRLDAGDSGLRPVSPQTFGGIGTMGPGADIVAWVYPKEHSPDPTLVVTAPQVAYLRQYISTAAASLTAPNFIDPVNGYAKYFDVPAIIDHQILNIIAKNADANRLSAFWYKPRFGKLAAGPIWDFDRAEGSTDGRDLNPRSWRGEGGDLGTDFFHYPWYNEMFKDPNFWQAFIDRFEQLRQGVLSTAHVHAVIDEFAAQLNPGNAASTPAKRSGARWIGPRGASASTPGTDGTFTGEMQWLKNWWAKAGAVTLNGRLDFMDGQFTRPAVASLPSGPVAPGSTVTLTSPSLSTPGVKIYYTTNGTDPRPTATAPEPPAGINIATLLPETGTVRAIVPTSAATGGATGTEWRGETFDDSTWYTNAAGAINGVGYDDAPTGVNFLPLLNVRWNTGSFNPGSVPPTGISPVSASNVMRTADIGGTSYPGNQTCYLRLPFTPTAADLAKIVAPNKLLLQMRYDDGFVAWLNGVELTPARANAPATNTLTFSSAATTTHEDLASTVYVDYDISAFAGGAHAGNNVLAIQGLNFGLPSSDFLCQARLVIQAPYTPALSAAATEYTGPLTINAPTELFVRTVNPIHPSDPPTLSGGGVGTVPNGSPWSAPTRLYYFPGASSASQANIRITEVYYHPVSPTADEIAAGFTESNDFEFIRLTNTGAVPVDLTGIFFSTGINFTATPGLQNWLPGGQSVVVVENTAGFISRYGTSFTILGQYQGELDDGGEHIVLKDRTGAVISEFIYDDTAPWPVAADGERSLLYLGGDPTLPGSWQASVDPGGTMANTFAQWQRRYFSNADVASQPMSADTDKDALNNLGEYAFATDPRTPGSSENSMARSIPGNPPALAVRRRAGTTDVTYTFETATGLTGWTPSGAAPESIVNNGDGTETVTWRAPAVAGNRVFMHVKVTSP